MKIKDIVTNHRIITVSESEELYTKNINQILQRDINDKRIKNISNYLVNTNDHFFSSIIVAIHKGNPEWSDVDVSEQFTIKGKKIDTDNFNFINNKIGILTLSGGEEIFALDGQHRLVGLRDAIKKNEELGEEEISLVYVIHNQENAERTRRLFTVLNKYAEKPKKAELIILEEDDVAAINTRRLVTNFEPFKKENALTPSKTSSISNSDLKSFTTLVTINKINTILYSKNKNFYTVRPSKKDINIYYKKSLEFWNFIFESFPEIEDFIDGKKDIKLKGKLFNRNTHTGGSLLLRPVGQENIAKVYKYFDKIDKLDFLKKNIRKIDFSLTGPYFNYIFWNNGNMVPKELKLKLDLILFLLGEKKFDKSVNEKMKLVFDKYNLTFKKIKSLV
jgi:DNA sulfur modification protein DndB